MLDDLWRRELLARAAADTERELVDSGRGVIFAVFRDYFLSEEELDYEAVAQRHGVTKIDVSNYLTYAKRRYRLQLKNVVLDTVRADRLSVYGYERDTTPGLAAFVREHMTRYENARSTSS